MSKRAEANACISCARSKRKCGRQMPSCSRCVKTKRPCSYPSSGSRVAFTSRLSLSKALGSPISRGDDILLREVVEDTSSYITDPNLEDDLTLDFALPVMDVDLTTPSPLMRMSDAPETKADWFLAPETWTISHRIDHPDAGPVGNVPIKKYMAVLHTWFDRWATTGSCPFIHAHLYRTNFPACVQVAYTTLASYTHRTIANTAIILRIVEERSTDLLRENGAVLNVVGSDEWVDEEEKQLDLFAQLARLHALLVYQIVGLLDGDIRSRHVAEGRLAVQRSWNAKLLQSAAEAGSVTRTATTHIVGSLLRYTTHSQQQWYLWVLSESIRRTWLVAASLASVYLALQQRWSICPGFIMYTNRNGLWDAESATEWEKQRLTKGVQFLQRFNRAKLLTEVKPADIDEFGTVMLDMTFNKDLLEEWRNKSNDIQQAESRQSDQGFMVSAVIKSRELCVDGNAGLNMVQAEGCIMQLKNRIYYCLHLECHPNPTLPFNINRASSVLSSHKDLQP
jgi:hypothetical protein